MLIVGNGAVGKSSMIQRYCRGTFTKTYKKTGSGGQIEIGGAELYESRCTIHWAVPDLELTPDLFYGR